MKRRVFPVLALLALVAIALLPIGASATNTPANKHQVHHKPHFFKHKGIHASSNNLNYGGGPVMGGTMNAYAIFWEPTNG
jgi:hypothetical protein